MDPHRRTHFGYLLFHHLSLARDVESDTEHAVKSSAKTLKNHSEEFVDSVVKYYLASSDFNGYPYRYEASQPEYSPEFLKSMVRPFVSAGRLSVRCIGNPSVKMFPDGTSEEEVKRLEECDMRWAVLYPTTPEMKRRVRASKYKNRPYSLELARGAAQLEPRFFDLMVLEQYRNDPRYVFQVSDMGGTIYSRDGETFRESDSISLQTFGFAYDDSWNRAAAVYLRYLHDLSPQHQQIWKARELPDDYALHPDYYTTSLRGFWPDKILIIDALLMEIETINAMVQRMGKPPLFKETFRERKPPELMFLIRPTAREFGNFVHLLDKVLSDNINPDFFRGDILMEFEVEREDRRVEVQRKGTLRLLEEWITARFRSFEGDPLKVIMPPLKKVRKLRQRPAHALDKDRFDQVFFKEQRELIGEVYAAVRMLRLIFANHPSVEGYEVNEFLFEGKIRTY